MDVTFYEDLSTLCRTRVADTQHAEQILDVLADLISDELMALNTESRELCCGNFIKSEAYRQELLQSRERIVDWLVETDKLHTQRLLFVGLVVLYDLKHIIPHINASKLAFQAVIEIIWTYRFTEPQVVETFLRILFKVCVHSELDEETIDSSITVEFVNYLYRSVQEDDSIREPLMVLVALNDQFMLHDKRGSSNKVFDVLQLSTTRYSAFCSSLVLTFNRCDYEEQDLKIFISKFLYLVFTTPSTTDLLYTNDLLVLAEIVIRELNDLPVEAFEVRAMYLRLLYAMLKHSPIEHNNPKLRGTLVQVLRMTLEASENLPVEDQHEINRLAERCLEIPWLGWRIADSTMDQDYEQTEECINSSETRNTQFNGFAPSYMREENGVNMNQYQKQHLQQPQQQQRQDSLSSQRARRPPPPPPPPPPRRHQSIVSVASSDSHQSIEAVEHVRPPPPPRRR